MQRREGRWIKILTAAARLAGLYGLAVLLLLIPFEFFVAAPADIREVFLGSPLAAAAGFLIGFLLLAIARLYGFGLLWILLLWAWLNMARLSFWPPELLPRFVFWTVFAAPLYGLTAIGLGASNKRSQTLELLITIGLWTTAVVLALTFAHPAVELGHPGAPYRTARAMTYICGSLPILLSSRELVRIGRAAWTTKRVSRGSLTSA